MSAEVIIALIIIIIIIIVPELWGAGGLACLRFIHF